MNLYEVYWLGYILQYLRRAAFHTYTVKGEKRIFNGLISLFDTLDILNINEGIQKLFENIKGVLEKYKEGVDISDKDANALKDVLNRAETLIIRELTRKIVFESISECALDRTCLVKLMNLEQSAFFDNNLWEQLSDMAKSDFSDASKCLLLGAATPAAMITLRAAEDIIRRYYQYKTNQDFTDKAWGTITSELKRRNDVNKDLIQYLDYIRIAKRNLTQHPEKIYTQREAERTFMEILSAAHDIYMDMLR